MSDYKRLTDEELSDFLQRAAVQLCPELTQQLLSIGLELVQYRGKIEKGTLIELPCKVGDKFYQVVKGLPIYEWEVETIVFSNIYFPKNYVITARRTKDLAFWKFWSEDLGETIFLTKAQAEKKLAELKGAENENK